MPQRELYWEETAEREFGELLERRKDKNAVLNCVEQHLLSLAANLQLAQKSAGPLGEFLYRFKCFDGAVALYLQAIIAELNDGRIAVVRLHPIQL